MTYEEPERKQDIENTPAEETPAEPSEAPETGATKRHLPVFDAVELRVLGCLMEKQRTTPAYYPMTLNSLTQACNQKSSRDPVVEYSESMVTAALEHLREKRLACRVSTAGSHVPKHRHLLENLADLSVEEYAVLCVLLLRGPQTVGQLRSRTERIHKFQDLQEVQEVLNRLAHDLQEPWVTMLPREAGRKDHRFAHLLGDIPAGPEPATVPAEAIPAAPDQLQALSERVTRLEDQLQKLREEVNTLRAE